MQVHCVLLNSKFIFRHEGAAKNIRENWTVQRQDRYGFSAIACDQAIEQTANRDSKTKGGMIGLTLNRGAVHRWFLSQSERSAIARQCFLMTSATNECRCVECNSEIMKFKSRLYEAG